MVAGGVGSGLSVGCGVGGNGMNSLAGGAVGGGANGGMSTGAVGGVDGQTYSGMQQYGASGLSGLLNPGLNSFS